MKNERTSSAEKNVASTENAKLKAGKQKNKTPLYHFHLDDGYSMLFFSLFGFINDVKRNFINYARIIFIYAS